MADVVMACGQASIDRNPRASPEFGDWLKSHRFSHNDFTLAALAAVVQRKQLSITVIIPGKEVASTIFGVITKTVIPLVEAKIVSRLVVIDAASKDGTGVVAATAHSCVEVIQRADIAPEYGNSRGKGDALWRALLATDGDIVAFLDGDTGDPSPNHLIGILGPLVCYEDIYMVRACFDRPFKSDTGHVRPHEGGRVTELLARPLLNVHWPDLAGFRQPLAGEFAARRDLLEQLSFPVGYGIGIGTLVDTYNLVGLQGLAEVDVGQRQNAHKPLRELTTMAKAILGTAESRLNRGYSSTGKMYIPWENDYREVDSTERPPLRDYRVARMSTPALSPPPEVPDVVRTEYPCPPFIMIDGVRMFRDIGGYLTTSSRIVRPGRIYRSGEPDHISSEGKMAFLKLGIEKIFDFRSQVEKYAHVHEAVDAPRSQDSAAEVDDDQSTIQNALSLKNTFADLLQEGKIDKFNVPVFTDEEWAPDRREARLKNYATAAEGYAKAYRHTLAKGVSAFRPIFEHLAQPSPSPILVHCTAGKDRTGVIAMLILLLAGCDASTIAKEYALNNLDSDKEWGASATQRLLTQPGLSGNVDAVANVVQARKEYMLATIAMFEEEFGGIERYLVDNLGLDQELIPVIKANIIL